MIWDINICTSCDSQRLPVSIVWPCDLRLGVNTCLTDLSCLQYLLIWLLDVCFILGYYEQKRISKRIGFDKGYVLFSRLRFSFSENSFCACFVPNRKRVLICQTFVKEGTHKATLCWSSLILIFHGSHPRNVYLYYLNVLIVLRFVLLKALSILFFSFPLKKVIISR